MLAKLMIFILIVICGAVTIYTLIMFHTILID